jgi:hypothetical protein
MERGACKYSRDTPALFERHGLETLHWEGAPGQHEETHSLLWAYVGVVRAPDQRTRAGHG